MANGCKHHNQPVDGHFLKAASQGVIQPRAGHTEVLGCFGLILFLFFHDSLDLNDEFGANLHVVGIRYIHVLEEVAARIVHINH